MKSLEEGNYALCIAHPGHELRLHGFLEQASPFVFILTDGSHRAQQDLMMDSIKAIDKACKQSIKKVSLAYLQSDKSKKIFKLCDHSAPMNEQHLKDTQIYNEIVHQHTGLLGHFIEEVMCKYFIKYKITHVVADSSEGYNVCHEIMRIMTDIAVEQVKRTTGKEIKMYDFSIERPYNEIVSLDCIHIQLDDAAVNRKLDAIIKYPLAVYDLRPNITMDPNLVLQLNQMKDGKEVLKGMLKDLNPDFFRNEYLRPYTFTEPVSKPIYETHGEKAVAAEKYVDVITYKDHLKPLKEKLEKFVFNKPHVRVGN